MRKSFATAGAAVLAIFAATSAQSQKLTAVNPYPGSTQTVVFGINDDGVIVGSYIDGNDVEHGFFGPLNGAYTSFDFGQTSTGTEPRGMDGNGNIVGFATDSEFTVGEQFFRSIDGKISQIERKRAPLDGVAQGMTTKVRSVGDYVLPGASGRVGYLAKNGKYKSDLLVDVEATSISPRAIGSSGATVGFFLDNVGGEHGYLQEKGGTVVIDAGDGMTVLEGVGGGKDGLSTGPFSCAAGQFTGSDGLTHAFVFNPDTGKFTAIDIPGSTSYQQAWGMNKSDQVAVSSDVGSFIWQPSKTPDGHRCPTGGIDARFQHAKVRTLLQFQAEERRGSRVPALAHPRAGAVQ